MLNRFLPACLLILLSGAAAPADAPDAMSAEAGLEADGAEGLSRLLEIIEHINTNGPPVGDAASVSPASVSPASAPDAIIRQADRPGDDELADLGGGRWRRFRTHLFDTGLDDAQRAALAELEAIGYLSGSMPSDSPAGVVRHDPGRAWQGLNLYTSGHAPIAVLTDMAGTELHRWTIDFWSVWPDYPARRDNVHTTFLRRAYLQPDGSLLAIFEGLGLVKVDHAGNLLWEFPGKAHHDLDFLPNGDIAVLTREAHIVRRVDPRRPVLEDFCSVLDPETGREKSRLSLLEAMERSDYRAVWDASRKRHGDIFHTNTLNTLDGSLAGLDPAFRAGNLLTSFLWLDTIAIIDLEAEKLVWAKQGAFKRQHDPKQLPGGTVLVFDNRGRREMSAVYEYDPVSWEIVWEYKASEEIPFYTATCGAAHRLPNGNTLIVESDGGRAFEVTRERETVWEFVNPHRAGENDEYIATLFNVDRHPPDYTDAWRNRGDGEASLSADDADERR